MFLEYDERFGLTKPLLLSPAPMQGGVIARRISVGAYDANATYDLTQGLGILL
jgi:hypothetical protein